LCRCEHKCCSFVEMPQNTQQPDLDQISADIDHCGYEWMNSRKIKNCWNSLSRNISAGVVKAMVLNIWWACAV